MKSPRVACLAGLHVTTLTYFCLFDCIKCAESVEVGNNKRIGVVEVSMFINYNSGLRKACARQFKKFEDNSKSISGGH